MGWLPRLPSPSHAPLINKQSTKHTPSSVPSHAPPTPTKAHSPQHTTQHAPGGESAAAGAEGALALGRVLARRHKLSHLLFVVVGCFCVGLWLVGWLVVVMVGVGVVCGCWVCRRGGVHWGLSGLMGGKGRSLPILLHPQRNADDIHRWTKCSLERVADSLID
jgi:hypothetical protein